MGVNLEQQRVLRIIQNDGDMESLVEWKVSYGEQLAILRFLLQHGYLTRSADGIIITAKGQRALTDEIASRPPQADPLTPSEVRQSPVESVHVPDDEV